MTQENKELLLKDLELVCEDNWSDAVSDLFGKTYLTHYCTIPQLPIMEDEDDD